MAETELQVVLKSIELAEHTLRLQNMFITWKYSETTEFYGFIHKIRT